MINIETKLVVTDNSGAKLAQCIKILNKQKYGSIGSWLVVSLKNVIPAIKQKNRINIKKKVLKGDICLAVIVRIKKNFYRKKLCEYINYSDNAVILYRLNKGLMFTRIQGFVALELRMKGFMKIILLADGAF